MNSRALATAVDLDERTRIGGQHAVADAKGSRRRTRRSAPRGPGTILRTDTRSHDDTTGRARTAPPTTKRVVWGISIAAALIVVLVGAGVFAAVQGARGIPVVTDVHGTAAGTTVTFTWDDPGIEGGDAYVVAVDGVASPMQRDASYVVTVADGDRVCATVTVTRDGKSGAPSAERCVDVEEGVG